MSYTEPTALLNYEVCPNFDYVGIHLMHYILLQYMHYSKISSAQ